MKIKLLTLACALGMLMGPAVQAQPEGGPPGGGDRKERMKKHMERMAEDLGLTDEQKEQLKAHHQEQAPKIQAIMQDDTLDREQKKAEMMKLREEREAFLESVLSPEQLAKHKEKREQMKGKMKDRLEKRKEKRGGGGPAPATE